MPETVEISREGGLFALDPTDPRVIRGLLLPFGEAASQHAIVAADGTASKAEGDVYEAGDVQIPRDPSVATLNRDHDRFDPIGRAVELEETDDGVVAAFRVADTDEGDAYLAEYANGQRRALSAEIAKHINAAGQIIRRVLSGAAVVPQGAFASAHLYSLVIDEPQITEPAPAEPDTGESPTIQEEVAMPEAVAPVTLGTGATTPQVTGVEVITKGDLFAALQANAVMGVPIPEKFKAAGELFAFGTATSSQGNVIPAPQWLGEVWDGIGFTPKYSGLVAHSDLSALSVKGWKITTKPTTAAWAGDAAAVDGAVVATTAYTANANRIAGGNRIPREYIDFGETQFIESILRLLAEDYARDVDAAVGAALIAGATALASAATTPLPLLVDAAIAVVNAEDTPAWALVHPTEFAAIAGTTETNKLAYITITLDWGGGNVGGLTVVPSSLVGTGVAVSVLVGSKNALRLFELPGSPIRVDAAAVQNGAVDHAVFGYYATLVEKATGLQLAS